LPRNNPAIMGYITHLHLATAIAAGRLAWYGERRLVVGVDNGGDLVGIGRGITNALDGTLQL